jgi:RNA-binding protein
MNDLSGKQRRFLRGLGNRLKPTVNVGKGGVSPELLRAIEDAFSNQELIKIKLERGCPIDRKEVGPALARDTDSYLVQILGQTVLLYRQDEENPTIRLP